MSVAQHQVPCMRHGYGTNVALHIVLGVLWQTAGAARRPWAQCESLDDVSFLQGTIGQSQVYLEEVAPQGDLQYAAHGLLQSSLLETAATVPSSDQRQQSSGQLGASQHNGTSKNGTSKNGTDELPDTFAGAMTATFVGSADALKSLTIGCALVIGVIFFEVFHKRSAEIDLSAPFPTLDNVEHELDRATVGPLQGAARLWYLYAAESQHVAMLCVSLIVVTILMSQYANTLLVDWSNVFWGDMEEWGKGNSMNALEEFHAQLLHFLFYALFFLLASAYQDYVVTMFTIHVRSKVTRRYVGEWMQDFVYYRLELYRLMQGGADADNPDQRIQEDADSFISGSIRLTTDLVSNLIQLCIFSVTVWSMSPADAFGVRGLHIPGWLFWCEFTYAVLSTLAVRAASIKLEALQATSQRAEADFRWELTTVRRNAEGIALGRGEAMHQERIYSRFDVIRRCVWENMMVQKRYSMVSAFFSQVEVIVTLFLLGPAFLRGEATLGTVMAVNRATGLLSDSLLWFANSYGSIASWRASTGRLIRFEEAMSRHLKMQAGAKVCHPKSDANGLEFNCLKVWTPAAIPTSSITDQESPPEIARVSLLDGLSLTIPLGSKVLLSGPSGAGKSTLFRALSGAWPWAEGEAGLQGGMQGVRVFPTEVIALPGQLREVVAYPVPLGERSDLDEDISNALRLAGLEGLLQDGLDRQKDWGLALSAGQKARLSLARLVLHKPRVAALDEPVAHLDMPARAPLLRAALEVLPDTTVLVISHDIGKDIQSLFDSKYALDVERKSLCQL